VPIEIRDNIYEGVLAVPHSLHLFQDPGYPVESFIPEKPYAWLALLYTNRQISEDAKAVLYGSNRFTLQEVETAQLRGSLLESFINRIGPFNAGSLSHLCINFPATEMIQGQSGGIRLREDSLRSLQLLQKQCAKLTTLETLIYSKNSKGLIQEDQKFVREVLLEINSQFRGISCLKKIVVRVQSGSPALRSENSSKSLDGLS
jgi:hypothetical protein